MILLIFWTICERLSYFWD